MVDTTEGGQLAGKVAVVTGSTSGSGRAIARRFAAEGASVVMLARGAQRLTEMESLLGPSALGIPTDITDPDAVRSAFATVADRFGKVDILVNNAGVYRACPFDLLTDDDVMAHVQTNLLGPIYTSRAAIPLLRAAGGGDIVNTSSESTIELFPMMSMYAVSKAGLEQLGRMLGMEYEREDIRVTTLVQGVALGEGGGSTDWDPGFEHAGSSFERLQEEGTLRRIMGVHGGMNVDSVAEVHLFIVTRPRGQKLDLVRARSY